MASLGCAPFGLFRLWKGPERALTEPGSRVWAFGPDPAFGTFPPQPKVVLNRFSGRVWGRVGINTPVALVDPLLCPLGTEVGSF